MYKLYKNFVDCCLTLLVCILVSSPAIAKTQTGLPSGICSNSYYQCDDEAKKRWSLFQTSNGTNIKHKNYLSVGSCSKNGVSNREVFVLLALSSELDEVYFDAKISFHNDLSNYHNRPASAVHELFPEIQYSRNLMSVSDTHAYIDYSKNAPFRYWIRYNPDEDKMMMVAYFGYIDTFLCEFQPV